MTRLKVAKMLRGGNGVNTKFIGCMLYPAQTKACALVSKQHTFTVILCGDPMKKCFYAMFWSDVFGEHKAIRVSGKQVLGFIRRNYPRQ